MAKAEAQQVKIRGYSDDIISYVGDLVDEIDVYGKETGVLKVGKGVELRYTYNERGQWKFVPLKNEVGATIMIVPVAPDAEDENGNYSDIVTVIGDIDAIELA